MAGPAGSPGDVGMTKPNDNLQTQGNLRALMDSVGLWLFLFAAFALLTLSIGEKKIQKRMQLYHSRVIPTESQASGEQAAVASEQQGADAAVAREMPYIYELTGLRWIFGIIASVGLALFLHKVFNTFRPPSGATPSDPA